MACRFGAKCIDALHDHLHTNGKETHCADCGQACYYDMRIEDYQHSNADAPDCFLITRKTEGASK